MSQRNPRFLTLLALLATASPALALYNFGGPDVECYVLAGKPDGLAKGAFYVECTNLVTGGIVGTIFHGNKGREACHTVGQVEPDLCSVYDGACGATRLCP